MLPVITVLHACVDSSTSGAKLTSKREYRRLSRSRARPIELGSWLHDAGDVASMAFFQI
jgi:hypothetical protein